MSYEVFIVSPCGPFYYHGLTLIKAWISNHMSSKVWDEIIHSPLKCGEWISHIIPQFIMDIITYPCWSLSLSMLVRGPLVENYVIKGAYSTIQLKLMAAFLSPIRQLNFSHSSGWQKGYFLVMGTTLPVGRREIVILFQCNVISIQHSSFSPKYPSTHPTFKNLTFNLFFWHICYLCKIHYMWYCTML